MVRESDAAVSSSRGALKREEEAEAEEEAEEAEEEVAEPAASRR